jgi:hypothetical protein
LILDGQWDDVMGKFTIKSHLEIFSFIHFFFLVEFIQPLEEALQLFNIKKFKYAILRHKYVELLCIRSEAACNMDVSTNMEGAVEEVLEVLKELEKLAPTKEEYSQLCKELFIC